MTEAPAIPLSLLSRLGLRVSSICLGTMNFGGVTSEADSHAILDAYVAAGGNFVDTADCYSNGESERVIGRWLQANPEHRDELIIASKVFAGPNSANLNGLSRHHILNSIQGSLSRLQTDRIDIYQIHCWDHLTPPEDWLQTMADLVRSGKVRYVGLCNVTG